MKVLNPKWVEKMRTQLGQESGVNEVLTTPLAIKWLIAELARANRPYRVEELGAGVKRITTNTTTCPCCRRPL